MVSASPIRVLIVDDHLMFAQTLERVLRDVPDIDVVGTAQTVADAVDLAGSRRPDVVLMDYELPDGNGADAARRILENPGPAGADPKVLMLTAFTDDDVLLAAIEAGCGGFLTKHRAVDEVAAAVRVLHAGEALITPSMLVRLLPRVRKPRVEPFDLTPRELEILGLMADGLSNRAIAERLFIAVHTVRNHTESIIGKLGAHSRLEAVARAAHARLIRFD